MPRKRPSSADAQVMDANQVVAYNFKLARETKKWTQEETAERLELALGQRLKKTSISAIERSVESDRRRVFTVQEVVAFALTFNKPFIWFLIPPEIPEGEPPIRLAGHKGPLTDLVTIVLGRDNQLAELRNRFNQLSENQPEPTKKAAAEGLGFGPRVSLDHYLAFRHDVMVDLVATEYTGIEELFEQMATMMEAYEKAKKDLVLVADIPRKVYRQVSEMVLGNHVYSVLRHDEQDRSDVHRSPILDLVMRDDVPWEDLIDTNDAEVRKAIQNLGRAIEPAVNRYLDATKE